MTPVLPLPTNDALFRTTPAPAGDVRYLSRADVEHVGVTFEEIRAAVRDAFLQKAEDAIESPPKRGVALGAGTVRAMAASIPSQHVAGVKWVSDIPEGPSRGVPTVQGLIVLNDFETGAPKAVLDGTWITAVRTAASTSLAAQALARPDSSTMGLVACGAQGRMNLAVLCEAFPIESVAVYDVEPERAEAFARDLAPKLDVSVRAVLSAGAAVRDADIVVTSASTRRGGASTVLAASLPRGAFACLLDFDTTFSASALASADRLIVDDMTQFLFFRHNGHFLGAPKPDAELGHILAGARPGRTSDKDRIVSVNLGVGFLDVVAAELVFRRAVDMDIGTVLPL